jgi:PTS system nitrogen regulatory IIA component
MVHDDFDIARLAKYLHLSPDQVSRMAERGKLPGRKVAGSWRFARAEIHHWLEDRIGASDEEALVEVEGVLDRSREAAGDRSMSIAELLPLEAIAAPLQARTRSSVIAAMTRLAARTGWLWDPAKMAEAVRTREKLHPTALENGAALLHPRRPMPNILAQPFLALGRTRQGIPFGGSRGSLTDIFFLICSTDDRGHLRVLARLSRLIADGSLLAAVRQANDAQTVHQLVVAHEQALYE